MLPFEEARSRVLALAPALGAARASLDDATGRVLAEDVVAISDAPAFDYSAMDGYAVRASDFAGAGPWTLPVAGESRAGSRDLPALAARAVARIYTGAPLPPQADAVVMQEDVARDGDAARFASAPRPGAHVRRRGEDMAKGAVALARGTRLRAAHVALAASVDRAWLTVARRPVVTIVGTGDELRAPGAPGAPGSIAESNGVALRAMVRAAGGIARVAPFVGDDAAATERAFASALEGTDVLITVGGVSVGDHDLVRPALERVGVSLDFWKVAIKPGKPLAVGRKGARVVLGLPGNPVSALVTFALFGAPLLRAMQGDRAPVPPARRGRLTRPVKHAPGKLELVRATLEHAGDGLRVTPLANQASGAAVSLARADGLACVPSACEGLAEGAEVDVWTLDDLGA
jgi:molybdopterin molybdotransferase